jgi:hypothetical protein
VSLASGVTQPPGRTDLILDRTRHNARTGPLGCPIARQRRNRTSCQLAHSASFRLSPFKGRTEATHVPYGKGHTPFATLRTGESLVYNPQAVIPDLRSPTGLSATQRRPLPPFNLRGIPGR